MGAWSKKIGDSDIDMDYESNIKELCGIIYDFQELTKELLEENQLKIYEYWKARNPTIEAFQVLADLMVYYDCIFEPIVLEKCISCLKQDAWAKEDFERNYYINTLLNYLTDKTIPSEIDESIENVIELLKNSNIKNVLEYRIGYINRYEKCIIMKVNSDFDSYDYINRPFEYSIVYEYTC